MPAAPNLLDYVLVVVPLTICAYFALRGLVPVLKGRFIMVTVSMFAASIGISLILSFFSFALLSVMDDAVNGHNVFTGSIPQSSSTNSNNNNGLSELANSIVLPLCRFVAQSRFIRSVLVTFAQPTFLSVAGIASCMMLVYVRESLIRVGGDVTVLLEHFAVFSQASSSSSSQSK